MSLENYYTDNDKFEAKIIFGLGFPCCCCEAWGRYNYEYPCSECGHNLDSRLPDKEDPLYIIKHNGALYPWLIIEDDKFLWSQTKEEAHRMTKKYAEEVSSFLAFRVELIKLDP